jgi:hypothetical protein
MTRRSTREVTGLVGAGAAAFFAVLGFLPGSLAIVPAAAPALSSPQTLVLSASDASYLSPVTLTQVSGVHIEETRTLTPDAGAGSSSVSVWTVTTSDYDATHHRKLEPASRTFAIDLATAALVSCCGASIDGNPGIRQSGLSGYVFPAGAGRRAYDIFDTATGRPQAAAYSGSGTIDGIPAFQYTEDVTAAPAGESPLSSTDPELQSAHESYWVDPQTGAVLAITADEDLSLARPLVVGSSTVRQLWHASLTTTRATVTQLADQDRDVRHEATVARDVHLACLILAIAGIVIAWYGLSRRRRLPPAPHHLHARARHGGNDGPQITRPAGNSALKMPSDET